MSLVLVMGACGSRRESVASEPTHAAAPQVHQREAPTVADPAVPTADAAPSVNVPAVDAKTSTKDNARSASGSHKRAATEMRCTLRVSPKGIFVDGDRKSRAEAVAACKRMSGAIVVLEDDAPADDWKALEAALRREGVPILMRGPLNDRECMDNPLSKGCN